MAITTTSSLDGLFKSVYGDELVNLIPSENIIQQRVPFKTAKKIGKSFEFPVELRREHGATYATAGSGGFSLNASVPLTLNNVLVDGYQMVLRGQLDYESASRAVSGGPAAFASSTSVQVKSLLESSRNRIEVGCLYGQSDRGIGLAISSTNVSATSTTVQIRAADFAAGLWSAFEGANIEFRDLGALDNLVSSGTDAVFTVDSVDTDAKTITVTGTATGITALDARLTSGGSPLSGSPQIGEVIFFQGAYGNEQVGIDKIVTNTGTLFGVDASQYTLWKGNQKTVSGALTFEEVNEANSTAVSKGLDGDVTVLVSPSQWNNILNDQTALRRYDNSASKATWENGARGIRFDSQNGSMEFVAHKYVKDGDAFIIPMKELLRIGSQDVSFEIPGGNGRIFRHLDDNAAYEFRTYSNQNLGVRKPAYMTKITGFTL